MTREEAIETLRKDVCNSHHVYDCTLQTIITALQTLIPELIESNDERIRKWIVNFIEVRLPDAAEFEPEYRAALAWLEKQKTLLWNTPAVKEGDNDETIRKKLISLINWSGTDWDGKDKDKFVKFLEKHKKHNTENCDDETLKIKYGSWYICINDVYSGGIRMYRKGDIAKANKFMTSLDERSAAFAFCPVVFRYNKPEEFCKDILNPNI